MYFGEKLLKENPAGNKRTTGLEVEQFFIFLLLLTFFCSCKKNDSLPAPDDQESEVQPSGTRLELDLDSVYYFAAQTYLWYDQLPDYEDFAPRSFEGSGDNLGILQSEVDALTTYAINPETGKSFEYKQGLDGPAFSYITDENFDTNRKASVNVEGQGNDLGLYVSLVNNAYLFVRLVENGSPAAKAGVKRGMLITGIDGVSSLRSAAAIENALSGDHLGMTLQAAPNSQPFHVVMDKTDYISSPVITYKVIPRGNEQVGYLAMARFSDPDLAEEDLDKAFTAFANAKVGSLVVDLRYNGSGFVSAAEELANRTAPSSLNGKMMYAEHFNDLVQEHKAPILKKIPYYDENGNRPRSSSGQLASYADIDFSIEGNTHNFSKKGPLESVGKVVFIVSNMTASASELLINCLKPYLEVKLVGSTTYGKPVGTFGIPIDKYTLFLSQMELYNAKEESGYFNGFSPDFAGIDDVTHDFGDPDEAELNTALNYLAPGNANSGRKMEENGAILPLEEIRNLNEPSVTHLIENRLKLK